MNLYKSYKTVRIFICIFLFSAAFIYSEQYRIRSVNYEMTGRTRKYPLAKILDIDTDKVFTNRSDLDAYLQHKLVQLKNQRVLEDSVIIPSYGESEDIIPVDLYIITKDTWNIIALPYPKYDSNSGFVFKLKIKDYNFFGTMRTLNGDVLYQYEEKQGETSKHKIGGGISFDIPFKIGISDSNWSNSLSINYTIGKNVPELNFTTGVGFSLPLHKSVSFAFGFSQAVKYNPEYRADNDAFYLSESVYTNFPVTLAKTQNSGNIIWTPAVSVNWNWDPTQINAKWDGISRSDLKGPDVQIKHELSTGRIDWMGNYRQGYSLNVSQSFSYDTFFKTYTTSYSFSGEYYRAFKYAGFASRWYLFKNFGDTSEEGGRIRGVRDKYIKTDSALLVNLDIPVKVWQTDWRRLGLPSWTRWFDFEMQLAPFVDIAIGNNSASGTYYNIKDGWYATGLEIIGYPNKMRSIQGRISFGIDVVRFAEKAGNKIGFINKIVNKLFNTDWRTGSWYELSIGIGLHY